MNKKKQVINLNINNSGYFHFKWIKKPVASLLFINCVFLTNYLLTLSCRPSELGPFC